MTEYRGQYFFENDLQQKRYSKYHTLRFLRPGNQKLPPRKQLVLALTWAGFTCLLKPGNHTATSSPQ